MCHAVLRKGRLPLLDPLGYAENYTLSGEIAPEDLRIRTPEGAEVPFPEVATVAEGRGFATIRRVDRRRTVDVTADVDQSTGASTNEILFDLQERVAVRKAVRSCARGDVEPEGMWT